jgi:NIMA (never in mitosis gene a)-related kinase
MIGTPYYLSPEVWKRDQYDYKTDMWSLGVVAYEMAALELPFPANTME